MYSHRTESTWVVTSPTSSLVPCYLTCGMVLCLSTSLLPSLLSLFFSLAKQSNIIKVVRSLVYNMLMAGFHVWLNLNPSSRRMVFGWNRISIASLTNQFIYRAVFASTSVSLNAMQWSDSILCSATTDLSGWHRCRHLVCSLHLVTRDRPVCPM
jgi:hypothetical protein